MSRNSNNGYKNCFWKSDQTISVHVNVLHDEECIHVLEAQ